MTTAVWLAFRVHSIQAWMLFVRMHSWPCQHHSSITRLAAYRPGQRQGGASQPAALFNAANMTALAASEHVPLRDLFAGTASSQGRSHQPLYTLVGVPILLYSPFVKSPSCSGTCAALRNVLSLCRNLTTILASAFRFVVRAAVKAPGYFALYAAVARWRPSGATIF